jgi:glycosyltransferase involved in cell wall biosynthesis
MKEKLIVLRVPSLKLGGAERNLVWLGQNLEREGYRVQVWVYDPGGPQIANTLDVRCIYSEGQNAKALKFFLRIYYLIRNIRIARPFAMISFLESISLPSLAASIMTCYHSKHLVSIRGNPQKFTWYYNVLVKVLYPKAKYVVIPSSRAGDYLRGKFGLENIANISNAKPETAPENIDTTEKIMQPVIAIGRFIQSKRFDLVIEIVAALPAGKRRLTLIGDGPLKEQLLALAGSKNVLINHVTNLNGKEVLEYLAASSLLISASETECWPNVLVESLTAGTPVVAADINFGPSEIIQEAANGYLFQPGNISEAAGKVEGLLTDRNLYDDIARATKTSVEKYASRNIIDQWINLIEK